MISKNIFYNSEIQYIIQNKLKTDNKINVLEIGAFNGSSSSWLIDNFKYDNSLITIIKPSDENSSEIQTIPFKKYELFIDDNKKVLYPEKIQFYNNKSICNLPVILNDKRHYDVIFINGSHLLQDIYEDIEMCWDLLASNGYLFIDEYENSIDEIFKSFAKNKYEIISNGSKIIVKKLS